MMPPRARQEMLIVAAVPMRKDGMERPSATTILQLAGGESLGDVTSFAWDNGRDCSANSEKG
jgi:hypothetical protein